MILTNEQLKRIIEGKPVGDYYPYNMKEYDSKPIDDYLSKVIGSLNQINSLEFESIFDHYGSGFASYVDVFCWKKDGSSSSDLRGVLWRNGIRIYLCRLAPIAVLGKGQITKHATGGSRDFLNVDIIDSLPNGDWAREVANIKKLLNEFSFQLPDKESLLQPLDFQTTIPTIFSDTPYKVYDALFYWED